MHNFSYLCKKKLTKAINIIFSSELVFFKPSALKFQSLNIFS